MEPARLLPATFAGSAMISFTGLLIVGVVAVAVPLLLGLIPAVKVPAVVLEILGGVLVGPAVLGWVHLDVAVRVTSDLGLGFLLFMAGYEIDLRRFDSRVLILVGRASAVSAVLALLLAYGLRLGGEVRDGLLVGITLMSTSLGVLVPILNDADQTDTYFGRLIMAAGSLAELAPLVLLSVFFSASSKNPSVGLGLLAGFVGLTAVVVVVTQRVRGWAPLREVVQRLEDTSSQLRVRLAITFALAFAVAAEHFGLATILGASLAGLIVRRTDESPASQQEFQGKLEAIGFGFLIPVLFVSTGVGLGVASLFHSAPAIIDVPVFLVALLAVRGAGSAVRAGRRPYSCHRSRFHASHISHVHRRGYQHRGPDRSPTGVHGRRPGGGRPVVGHLPAGRTADAEERRRPRGVAPSGPRTEPFLVRQHAVTARWSPAHARQRRLGVAAGNPVHSGWHRR
jgi:Kef-type K+ transport system membrane component KefB